MIFQVWDVISGLEAKLEGTDSTMFQEWKQKDLLGMGLIINSISLEIGDKLEYNGFKADTMTSKDLMAMTREIVLFNPRY